MTQPKQPSSAQTDQALGTGNRTADSVNNRVKSNLNGCNSDKSNESAPPSEQDIKRKHPQRSIKTEEIESRTQQILATLEIQKQKDEVAKQKALADLEIKQKEFEIEKQRQELEEQAKNNSNERKKNTADGWLKRIVSTTLLGTGIFLTWKGDHLGAYLMGTAAGGAGIEASQLLKGGKEEKPEETEKQDAV